MASNKHFFSVDIDISFLLKDSCLHSAVFSASSIDLSMVPQS
jgi:hypothetical protein